MEDFWNIKPKEGLGPLQFGMSETDAIKVGAPLFGAVESAGTLGQQSDEEVYQILLDTMGEEAAREAMEALAQSNISFKPSRRVVFSFGVMADFVEDKLDGLMGFGVGKALHFEGNGFYGVDPRPALAALQVANGGPPLMKGSDCHFRALDVTAFDVVVLDPDGTLRVLTDGTDEAEQKTIGWRQTPRNPDEDFSDHVLVDLAG